MKKFFLILISLFTFFITSANNLISNSPVINHICNASENNDANFTSTALVPQNPLLTLPSTSIEKTIFAFKDGKNILLNYTFGCVGAEVKHEIQRSANGILFNTIFEETLLLAECGRTFNFINNNPIIGLNYYRIRLTDPDGKIRFSEQTSINFISGTTIQLAPTIATNLVNVYYPAKEKATTNWVIISSSGKIVQTRIEFLNKGQNTISFDVSSLLPGIYYIKALDNKNDFECMPFVKQ